MALGSAQPEATQSQKLLMLQPETQTYFTSLRGTPHRIAVRAAELLICTHKSKLQQNETNFFKQKRKRRQQNLH